MLVPVVGIEMCAICQPHSLYIVKADGECNTLRIGSEINTQKRSTVALEPKVNPF